MPLLSGGLAKLTITNLDTGNDREFGFNPTTLSFHQGVRYSQLMIPNSNIPKQDFEGGTGARLQFELLLDELSSEEGVKADVAWLLELLEAEPRTKVDPLTYEGERNRPPICAIQWGEQMYLSDTDQAAALTSISVTYTLFKSDGTPARAKANLTFQDQFEKLQKQNPTSGSEARKTWLVVEGETLDWIAYKEYGDSTQWRHIAETNNLSNPLALRPGQLLRIVPLP